MVKRVILGVVEVDGYPPVEFAIHQAYRLGRFVVVPDDADLRDELLVAFGFGVVLKIVGDDVELPVPGMGDGEECESRWAGRYFGGSSSGSWAWTKIKVATNINTLIALLLPKKPIPLMSLFEAPFQSF